MGFLRVHALQKPSQTLKRFKGFKGCLKHLNPRVKPPLGETPSGSPCDSPTVSKFVRTDKGDLDGPLQGLLLLNVDGGLHAGKGDPWNKVMSVLLKDFGIPDEKRKHKEFDFLAGTSYNCPTSPSSAAGRSMART